MKNSQNGVVLILEEDQELRDGIASLLIADGYRVIAARNEGDAAVKVQRDPPDLILATVNRSEEQALAAACDIREQIESHNETPIVVFSVTSIPEGAVDARPGNIHLMRPDNFDQLRALLHRLLS